MEMFYEYSDNNCVITGLQRKRKCCLTHHTDGQMERKLKGCESFLFAFRVAECI